jgi:predicted transcriptional regulator
MKKANYKTTVTFRLDKKLKRDIKKLARAAKKSPSAYIEQLVIQRLGQTHTNGGTI